VGVAGKQGRMGLEDAEAKVKTSAVYVADTTDCHHHHASKVCHAGTTAGRS